MDPSSHPNLNGSQPPKPTAGYSLDSFINSAQSYTNFPTTADEPNYDYIWDPSLFQTTEQAPVYPQQSTTPTPSWNQNALQPAAADSGLANYGSLHPTYQTHQYAQQSSYDPRPPSQTSYDPRSMSRPSPSPRPYPSYAYQSTLSFRDQSLTPQHDFRPQQPAVTQHRPPPALSPDFSAHQNQHRSAQALTPDFSAHPNQSPFSYFEARPTHHPNLPGMEMSQFSGYPEQSSRPAHYTIDPSYLTGNKISALQPGQYQVPSPQDQNQQQQLNPTYSMNFVGNENQQQQQQQQQPPPLPMPQDQTPINLGPSMQTGILVPPKPAKAPAKPKKPKDPNAPKRSRGRPKKDEAVSSVSKDGATSSSSSESDSELEIEVEAEPKPDILMAVAPEDPEGRAVYDAVQAVWFPRNKSAIPENVRSGIAVFGDTVRNLRDAWKVKNEALKQAELANTPAIAGLKHEVAQYRKIVELVAKKALEFGHDSHLAKLGENPFTMTAFQSFLVDRITAGDNDGSLVMSILQLVVKFKTMGLDMLERTKTSKILVRLTKKGGSDTKVLAQTVLNNAAAAAKLKSSTKPEAADSPDAISGSASDSRRFTPQVAGSKKTDLAIGIKRPRDTDGATLPATKRAVVPSVIKPIPQASKPLALQNAERKQSDLAVNTAKAGGIGPVGTSANVAGKPKIAVIQPPKPANSVFSALMSASKKPGTSIAARAAAAKDKAPSITVPKKESPPPAFAREVISKPTFSFMDTLADMSKPKEVESKKVDDRPPETEEERRKRLRKEERRKLRVSWKPDDSLLEIKTFTHDPDEETGHADSAMRDVGDVGGEGRMLKLHKDLDDLDDEEEAQALGEDLEPYSFPSEVAFDELDPDERSRNFVKHGGTAKPESPESEAQARREENTLMVVYSLPSDVPSTPKEPPASNDEDEYTPLAEFGEPSEATRSREAKFFAARNQDRLSLGQSDQTAALSAILQGMKQSQPAQPQQQQTAVSDLERTFGLFAQQQSQQQQVQQPAAAGDISNIAKLLALVNNAKQQFQVPQQPQFAPAVQQTQPAQPNLDLAALIAQMQNPQQAQTASPFGFAGAQNPSPIADNDYSRKHLRSDSTGDDYDSEYNRANGDRNWNKKKKAAPTAAQAKTHPKAKTVVCRFWQEGKCMKGDDCTFRHDGGL